MVPGRGYGFSRSAPPAPDSMWPAPPGGVTSRDELRTTRPGHRSDASWTSSIACAVAPGLGRGRARSLAEPLIVQAAPPALPNSRVP
jgi:hypothetical protein